MIDPGPHRYIVVEGPIGVGKSSLVRRLGDNLDCELLMEQVDENPYLADFYRNPRQAALQTQLFFLMQRAKQMSELRQGGLFSSLRIADFMIEKDPLFAELTLDSHEFEIYKQVYDQLAIDAPVPDLMVYLQAPAEVLVERIRRRGRGFERLIETAYLERLGEAYASYFLSYDKSPLLIVNAEEFDPINHDEDFFSLIERMRHTISGRHYFNPLPFQI